MWFVEWDSPIDPASFSASYPTEAEARQRAAALAGEGVAADVWNAN